MPPAWAPLGIVRSAGSTKALAKGSERRALAIMAGPPCGKRTRLTLYIQDGDGYVYNAWMEHAEMEQQSLDLPITG